MVSRFRSRRRRSDAAAAAWFVRLQSAERDEQALEAFEDWLDESSSHRAAFDRAREIWSMIPAAAALADEATEGQSTMHRPVRRWSRSRKGLALASLLLALCGGGWWLSRGPVDYTTRVGEEKVATLDDGTRIALNTNTGLSVSYTRHARSVALDHGEAMFEVAHNAQRPFIVTAGDKAVRAIGTKFIVRRSGSDVSVTLIEGKVAINQASGSRSYMRPTMLAAGERLIANEQAPPVIDHPSMSAATAWRSGQAIFNDTPLGDAIVEINRYGGPQIAVSDPRLAALRVSGVFATNDTAEFAAAVASLYGLKVRADGNTLRINR